MAVSDVLSAIFSSESEERQEILYKIYQHIFNMYKAEHPDAVPTQEQEFFCFKGMEALLEGFWFSVFFMKEGMDIAAQFKNTVEPENQE